MADALSTPPAREAWKEHLAAPWAGRRAIVALGPLAGLTRFVSLVREHGGPPPLVLASGLGAGPVPGPDEAQVLQLELPPVASASEDVRRQDRYLREELPAHVHAAISRFDPDRQALWLVGQFIDPAPLHGRPVFGGRPRPWAVLEDKAEVDSLWDAVGVRRAASARVAPEREALEEAHRRLAATPATGTVWSGDARDGVNGAGEYVRWVVTDEDRADALAFFAPRCDAVRVAPFLDGVPCSIHACVLPDGTAVLRPLELAILRGHGRQFVYGGLGTTWDPPAEDAETMRDVARLTGERLRELVGYRGFFGIDGILTAEGFRPTEVNTRLSAGVSAMAAATDPAAIDLLQLGLVAGEDPGVSVADLEGWLLPALDEHRFVKAVATGPLADGMPVEKADIPVRWEAGVLHRVTGPVEGRAGDGAGDGAGGWVVEVGAAPKGAYVRLTPPVPPPGLRAADVNVALMRFTDEEIGTRFGHVEPAPDVRASV